MLIIFNIGQSGTSLIHEINLKPGTTGGCVRIFDSSTVRAIFTGSCFGLGTTTPTERLHVGGNILVSGSCHIRFRSSNAFISEHGTDGLQIRTANSCDVVIKTNGNNARLRVKGSGNVEVVNDLIIGSSGAGIHEASGLTIGDLGNNDQCVHIVGYGSDTNANGVISVGDNIINFFTGGTRAALFEMGNDQYVFGTTHNATLGNFSSILGGTKNTGSGACGIIGGGCTNNITAAGLFGFIGSGRSNKVNNDYGVVAGGLFNCVCGDYGAIVGGCGNRVCSGETYSAIGGGRANCVDGDYSFIGGGYVNRVVQNCGVVAGGYANCVCANQSFIGGGYSNLINATGDGRNVLAGGYNSGISGTKGYHTIGGGTSHCINTKNNKNTIAGGGNNCICCCVENSTIGGGAGNKICKTSGNDYGSVIAGGAENCIINDNCFTAILGGYRNRACDRHATIGGGCNNIIQTGNCSAILGGKLNHISHDNAMVIGSNLSSSAACYTFMNNACVAGVTRTAFLVENICQEV